MSEKLAFGLKCCVQTCENVLSETCAVEFHRFPTDRKAYVNNYSKITSFFTLMTK